MRARTCLLAAVSGAGPDAKQRRNRELLPVAVENDVAWIPRCRDQTSDSGGCHVYHGDGIEPAECDEQRRAVRCDGQRRWRDAFERQAERLQENRGRDTVSARVNHRHRVGVRISHEQPLPRLVPRHRRRMKTDVDRVRHLQCIEVDACNRSRGCNAALVDDHAICVGGHSGGKRDVAVSRPSSAPVADPRRAAVRCDDGAERRHAAGLHGAGHVALYGVDHRDRVVEDERYNCSTACTRPRERRSAGEMSPKIGSQRNERRTVMPQQLHRTARPVAGGFRGDGDANQRALSDAVEDDTLKRCVSLQSPIGPARGSRANQGDTLPASMPGYGRSAPITHPTSLRMRHRRPGHRTRSALLRA